MPQLDPSSFSSQLFWLTVSFLVLYIVLARFFLPRIQSVIALRARTMEADITQAENTQSEAGRVQDAYEKALAETRAKAKAIIADAKGEIAKVSNKKQAELDSIIEKKLAESGAGIKKAKHDVMDKLLPVAGELAEKIVDIIIGYKPGSKELEAALGGMPVNHEHEYE